MNSCFLLALGTALSLFISGCFGQGSVPCGSLFTHHQAFSSLFKIENTCTTTTILMTYPPTQEVGYTTGSMYYDRSSHTLTTTQSFPSLFSTDSSCSDGSKQIFSNSNASSLSTPENPLSISQSGLVSTQYGNFQLQCLNISYPDYSDPSSPATPSSSHLVFGTTPMGWLWYFMFEIVDPSQHQYKAGCLHELIGVNRFTNCTATDDSTDDSNDSSSTTSTGQNNISARSLSSTGGYIPSNSISFLSVNPDPTPTSSTTTTTTSNVIPSTTTTSSPEELVDKRRCVGVSVSQVLRHTYRIKEPQEESFRLYDLSIRNAGSFPVKSLTLRINLPVHAAIAHVWNLTRVDRDATYNLPKGVTIPPGGDYSLSGYIVGGSGDPSVEIVDAFC